MRIPVILLALLFMFFTQTSSLREIKIGDPIPADGTLAKFKTAGPKAILYIKSSDLKSITFFKNFSSVIKKSRKRGKKNHAGLKLFVVDAAPAPDDRAQAIYQPLTIQKEYVRDAGRKIYGRLGIIVLPTLVLVNPDHTLHSFVAGNKANLNLFFTSYLRALLKGAPAGNVLESAAQQVQKKKIFKLLNQAFRLLINKSPELAEAMYQSVLKQDPENGEAILGRGYSLLLMEKTADALDFFTAKKKTGDGRRVLLGHLLCSAAAEPSEETLARLARAAQLEPRFFNVSFHAAQLLEKAGKCQLARDVYRHSYSVLLRRVTRRGL